MGLGQGRTMVKQGVMVQSAGVKKNLLKNQSEPYRNVDKKN